MRFKFIEFKLLVQVDCVVVGAAFGCGFKVTMVTAEVVTTTLAEFWPVVYKV